MNASNKRRINEKNTAFIRGRCFNIFACPCSVHVEVGNYVQLESLWVKKSEKQTKKRKEKDELGIRRKWKDI
jgi:hypothetical protein